MTNARILAIDDDPSVRQMIVDYLGDNDLSVTAIAEEGHAVLAGFVGEPLASLIFRDLAATLPKLTDRNTLKEYLEEGLRVWLPK